MGCRPGHESPVLSGMLSAATQAPPSARSVQSGWFMIFRQKLLFLVEGARGDGVGVREEPCVCPKLTRPPLGLSWPA